MTQGHVLDAAEGMPEVWSTFGTMARRVGLGKDLLASGAPAVTVLAPTNDAWSQVTDP